MEKFVILDELAARTAKGSVYKVRNKINQKEYVVKERFQAELGKGKNIRNEVDLLQKLKHPNLVNIVDNFWHGGALCMQLEYAIYGDLSSEITKRRHSRTSFSHKQQLQITRDVCDAVSYLHSHRVIHRDIKSLNVFIDASESGVENLILNSTPGLKFCIKLGDLGISRECSVETGWVDTYYGTPLYSSPELCENMPYNSATDIWSLGVLFYEIATLEMPFKSGNIISLAKKICSAQYPKLPNECPLKDLISNMLLVKPANRPTSVDVLATLQLIVHPLMDTREELNTPVEIKAVNKVPREMAHELPQEMTGNLENVPRLKVELRRQQNKLQNLKKVSSHSAENLTEKLKKTQEAINALSARIQLNESPPLLSQSAPAIMISSLKPKEHMKATMKETNLQPQKDLKSKHKIHEEEIVEIDYISRMKDRSTRLKNKLLEMKLAKQSRR